MANGCSSHVLMILATLPPYTLCHGRGVITVVVFSMIESSVRLSCRTGAVTLLSGALCLVAVPVARCSTHGMVTHACFWGRLPTVPNLPPAAAPGETHRHCGTLLLGGGSHHAIPLSLALALDDFVLQPQNMAHVLWYGTKSRNANARCILAQALGA